MYRLTYFIIFVFSIVSCQQDIISDNATEVKEGNIPLELMSYFESFQREASDRGITVDYETSNVTAEIQLINEGSVAGTCTTNGHNLRHIIIDQAFWNKAPHLLKEMIIYHELGHCILNRGHSEDSFDNGICRSIMRSGLGGCRDAYNQQNRDYFVSELFNEMSLE